MIEKSPSFEKVKCIFSCHFPIIPCGFGQTSLFAWSSLSVYLCIAGHLNNKVTSDNMQIEKFTWDRKIGDSGMKYP